MKNVLLISDLHAPYQHVDALRFLAAIKRKYRFSRIVSVGDEVDNHAQSFHDSDPDLDSAGPELEKARAVMIELEAMFPKMDILVSNHGAIPYRKALASGIPKRWLSGYRDALFAETDRRGNRYRPFGRGEGWEWHEKLVLDLGGGHKCLVVHGHGCAANTMRNVKDAGMSYVAGHHHSVYELVFHGTSEFLHFGMAVGCLADPHSLALAYGAHRVNKRPVLGCGAIIDGHPRLLPMQLKRGGRWNGTVP